MFVAFVSPLFNSDFFAEGRKTSSQVWYLNMILDNAFSLSSHFEFYI